MEFREFELQVGPGSGKRFAARVLRSPAGQAEGAFHVPMSARRLRESWRRGKPVLGDDARKVGAELFRALFRGAVGALFHQSLACIDRETGRIGLRLRLHLNPRDSTTAELRDIPWELLYREETDDFLALSRLTPIVRSLDIPRAVPSEPVTGPLGILLVSATQDATELDVHAEAVGLARLLQGHPGVRLSTLESASTRSLREALGPGPVHVLHYMGHGRFDRARGEGALLLCDDDGKAEAISARHLAIKLKDFPSLRLVTLNACDTACLTGESDQDPFSGVAAALVLAGVPAVVAMQTPIDDACAIEFSAAFYKSLGAGFGVDEALTEGRQALYSFASGGCDWATPVLYLRGPSGDVFGWETVAAQSAGPRTTRVRPALRILAAAATVAALSAAVATHTWLRSQAPASRPADRPSASPTSSVPVAPPSASAPPAHGAPLVDVGHLHFELHGSGAELLADALRGTARRDQAVRAPVHVRLEVSRPSVTVETLSDTAWHVCRLTVTRRITTVGHLAPARTLSMARAHLDAGVACRTAATAMAQAVLDETARAVLEVMP